MDRMTIELKCKHRFCRDCMVEELQRKIETNKLDKLKCLQHGCDQRIQEDTIVKILDGVKPEVLEKYMSFKSRF